MPAIASLTIYQFLWVWNDYLVALVFLGGAHPVVTYQVANLVTFMGGGWHLQTASAFISMILLMTVFSFMQRYFVKGMLAGSVRDKRGNYLRRRLLCGGRRGALTGRLEQFPGLLTAQARLHQTLLRYLQLDRLRTGSGADVPE